MNIFTILCSLIMLTVSLEANNMQLVSTESDTDSFVNGSVNVINGNYCEAATDRIIFYFCV